ncbi:MAG: hypothetical protein LBN29_02035 [Mediterranea sp.]|jgi:hypothetical protein|nr:hypothetical protein [Mediterranea sp.]
MKKNIRERSDKKGHYLYQAACFTARGELPQDIDIYVCNDQDIHLNYKWPRPFQEACFHVIRGDINKCPELDIEIAIRDIEELNILRVYVNDVLRDDIKGWDAPELNGLYHTVRSWLNRPNRVSGLGINKEWVTNYWDMQNPETNSRDIQRPKTRNSFLFEQMQSASIEEVENKIMEIYKEKERMDIDGWWRHDVDFALLLYLRQEKLNEAFAWTPETVQQAMHIQDRIMECYEQLRVEAHATYLDMEARLADKQERFLDDYELDCWVSPTSQRANDAFLERDEFTNIWDVLEMPIARGHELRFDKWGGVDNWRSDPCFSRDIGSWARCTPGFKGEEFADVYIGYALHALCDHCYWSIPDILQIDTLSSEIIVTKQHLDEKL